MQKDENHCNYERMLSMHVEGRRNRGTEEEVDWIA